MPRSNGLLGARDTSGPVNEDGVQLFGGRVIDLLEMGFDLFKCGWGIPIHCDLLGIRIPFYLGDPFELTQLVLDRHDTVSATDVGNADLLCFHCQTPHS